jgi:AcrR family transcriptional regulator
MIDVWRPPTADKGVSSVRLGSVRKPVPREIPATPSTTKPAHRERLLSAMTDAIGDHGYQATTVARVISYAGVSRATFYEHFKDRDDCFETALRGASTQLSRRFRKQAKPPGDTSAIRPALQDLLTGLAKNPAAGALLFIAAREATPTEENPLLGEFERLMSTHRSRARKPAFDISPIALLGGIGTVISSHLTDNASDQLPSLLDDLVAWADSHLVDGSQSQWSTTPQAALSEAPAIDPALIVSPTPSRPELLPRGRHGLPESVVTRNHRNRVLYAVAETAAANGYSASTVAELAASASIARQSFYDHFTDKEAAALQAQRLIYRHSLTGSSAAYFTGNAWPERVWRSLLHLTTLIAQAPAHAHLAIIEPYAIGQAAIQNLNDTLAGYAVILEEGYHQTSDSRSPPRLYSQAAIGAIFEVIRHHIAHGNTAELPKHLPELTYLAIAPFLGAPAAGKLVSEIANA